MKNEWEDERDQTGEQAMGFGITLCVFYKMQYWLKKKKLKTLKLNIFFSNRLHGECVPKN